jgi:radical SAM protein with 4Fe4S-binding SPASM domain
MAGDTKAPSRDALFLIAELQARVDHPLMATIELTHRCNLRCVHCYVERDQAAGPPTEVVKRWLRELDAFGVLFVTFTGGEITTRPDWLELTRYARELGFAVRLKTNGTAIGEAEARELGELAVFFVDISLYAASAEVHDAITKVPGSWQAAVAAIRHLRARGVNVCASIPVMRANAGELEATLALTDELGCNRVVDSRIHAPLDAERDNCAIRPLQCDHDTTVAVTVRHGAARAEPGREPKGDDFAAWPCLGTKGGLYIRADGELRHCPILAFPFGVVLDQPIDVVWRESSARRELLQMAQRMPRECESCDVTWACHRCIAHAVLEHGSSDRPAAIDCQHARARAKEALAAADTTCNTPGCATSVEGDLLRDGSR